MAPAKNNGYGKQWKKQGKLLLKASPSTTKTRISHHRRAAAINADKIDRKRNRANRNRKRRPTNGSIAPRRIKRESSRIALTKADLAIISARELEIAMDDCRNANILDEIKSQYPNLMINLIDLTVQNPELSNAVVSNPLHQVTCNNSGANMTDSLDVPVAGTSSSNRERNNSLSDDELRIHPSDVVEVEMLEDKNDDSNPGVNRIGHSSQSASKSFSETEAGPSDGISASNRIIDTPLSKPPYMDRQMTQEFDEFTVSRNLLDEFKRTQNKTSSDNQEERGRNDVNQEVQDPLANLLENAVSLAQTAVPMAIMGVTEQTEECGRDMALSVKDPKMPELEKEALKGVETVASKAQMESVKTQTRVSVGLHEDDEPAEMPKLVRQAEAIPVSGNEVEVFSQQTQTAQVSPFPAEAAKTLMGLQTPPNAQSLIKELSTGRRLGVRNANKRAWKTHLLNGLNDGLEKRWLPDKNRFGVFTAKAFSPLEFVIEYPGDYITFQESLVRKSTYPESDLYMFALGTRKSDYVIDATPDKYTNELGRFIYRSKNHPNIRPHQMEVDGKSRLFFAACRDIEKGVELLYDYGG